MALFRRTRRVNVGSYESPPDREPATIEHVVADGMLISTSAVRMAVKNRLIVDTLRDGRDFDAAEFAAAAREELLELARQNDDQAARVWSDGSWVDEPSNSERNQRKREVLIALAAALRQAAADDDQLARVVEEARIAAWDEIGGVLTAKLEAPVEVIRDEAYEREREGRIRALKEVDLAGFETFERYRDLLN